MKFELSNSHLQAARSLTPLATQTFSKGPTYWPQGASPLFMCKAKGCYTWDIDGNKFCDWVMGLGAVTLGYRQRFVDDAIKRQLRRGICFSQPSMLEAVVAEGIKHLIPAAEQSYFTKTGSGACEAAIRIARSVTGKKVVCSSGYHGWHDWYAAISDRPAGTLSELACYHRRFKYNDIADLESQLHRGNVAAVIMEPMIVDAPADGYLLAVRRLCDNYSCLLIFDEMVTGFRWPGFAAQNHFDVAPDLSCFGKGIANGMPLAAVSGREKYMLELQRVFVSTTFGGECLSLAAAGATMEFMDMFCSPDYIWGLGKKLMAEFNAGCAPLKLIGYPCRPKVEFPVGMNSPEVTTLFVQEMISRGHLVHNGGLLNLSYSHTEKEVRSFVAAAAETVEILWQAIGSENVRGFLRGAVITPAFRRL